MWGKRYKQYTPFCLQDDAITIYKCAEENNLSFSDSNCELLWYGKSETVKNQTKYDIQRDTYWREANGQISWSSHNQQCNAWHLYWTNGEKWRMQMGWIFRTFTCRDELLMITFNRSLLFSLLQILLSIVAHLEIEWNETTGGCEKNTHQ